MILACLYLSEVMDCVPPPLATILLFIAILWQLFFLYFFFLLLDFGKLKYVLLLPDFSVLRCVGFGVDPDSNNFHPS